MSHTGESLHLSFKPTLCSSPHPALPVPLSSNRTSALQASVEARTIRNKGIVHTKIKIDIIYLCHSSTVNTKGSFEECSL